MLDVQCEEHLVEVRAYADSLGAEVRKQLEERLEYLAGYRGGECVCSLYKDFAPYSFEFVMSAPKNPERRWFNGGLIFHEARSSGAGFPTLATRLNPASVPEWQIHT